MDNDIINLLIILLLLILVSGIFIRISVRARKYGGSMTTTLIGSTYDFLDKEKREASEEVVERKSKKKMSEDLSGDNL